MSRELKALWLKEMGSLLGRPKQCLEGKRKGAASEMLNLVNSVRVPAGHENEMTGEMPFLFFLFLFCVRYGQGALLSWSYSKVHEECGVSPSRIPYACTENSKLPSLQDETIF